MLLIFMIIQGSKFPLFRYSEYSKMLDGIVNFMISVFRLYGKKDCDTTGPTFKMSLMYLNCRLFRK